MKHIKIISSPEARSTVEGYMKEKCYVEITKINMQEDHQKYDNLMKRLI